MFIPTEKPTPTRKKLKFKKYKSYIANDLLID
ncbi:hypothetical protein M2459_002278 [Parabacteroides sp. PF5-5]|nr:hypothetical protein [Parabacteroides sp. PH5-39]MDH6316531.1 hypothetical protein [Parabacteroides sp. PF5-13]MDH6320041.1 hypothetical protein [Parabacteroides sp. PH5-13]MDH6323726.1 hypothetical protein [Parabacteroides sp. PH5-8]MDH6327718.1 hypothetical protein [Parabacteroides sp. PH5-41]MDH6335519.1 hypothetical protein [Parabacteroides sp. PF5-5]MDH6346537.1 hypothetical protein [Parabacteroides sp. PH5-46]MDH6361499.1 hypothetical protein [Parabacteroides sp. PH5-16]MDH6377166.